MGLLQGVFILRRLQAIDSLAAVFRPHFDFLLTSFFTAYRLECGPELFMEVVK
jgi:hypothetical protein